jgi:hypothetical protein
MAARLKLTADRRRHRCLVLAGLELPTDTKMKKIKGSIATDKVGSRCEFEFEMDDDATLQEIEEAARDAAFDLIDWGYTIDGKSP